MRLRCPLCELPHPEPAGDGTTPADGVKTPRGAVVAAERAGNKPPGNVTIARRVLASMFLLGWVVVAWVSYQTPYLQACSDQIARVGNSPLIRSCEPLSLVDAPMLVLLVAGVILLLPDLTAIEIPGFLRLERQVAEQGRRQDELFRMIQEVKFDIRAIQNIDFRPTTNIYNQTAERTAKAQRLIDENSEKNKLFAEQEEQLVQGLPERDDQSDDADAT